MTPHPGSIETAGLRKHFGAVAAVDGVDLHIAGGEFFSLLGPSGCGKTTLLRLIAGLEQPTSGSLHIGGREMAGVEPYHRPVNTVFQHYALFPHLSVAHNVAFGLRYKRVPRHNWPRRVADALALVQLAGLGERMPDELSGGQRQRVALARALVLEPSVLLLDEPLGALDQKLRRQMQIELKAIQRKLGVTFVFVTHDQEEALTMSDRIAVMNDGRVEQVGEAAEVFERPRTSFAAEFMGAGNFLTVEVTARGEGMATLRCEGATWCLEAPASLTRQQACSMVVRPEKLQLSAVPSAEDPSLAVTIEQRVYQGVGTMYTVRTAGGQTLGVYDQNEHAAGRGTVMDVGQQAFVSWHPEHTVILKPGATGG